MWVYAKECRYLQNPEQHTELSQVRVAESCESHDMDTRNQTCVLYKNSYVIWTAESSLQPQHNILSYILATSLYIINLLNYIVMTSIFRFHLSPALCLDIYCLNDKIEVLKTPG